jgi:hypothetical protein
MKYDSDSEAWLNSPNDKLWIFDKLLLSKHLGYTCGPVGVDVPTPGTYIVRPCTNLLGMGIGASFVDLVDSTDHLPIGYFWCEIFTGQHISVDYYKTKQILAVEGSRNSDSPLWKFDKWIKLDDEIKFPDSFIDLFDTYDYINVEYIDGKLIELHFRTNPDFEYGNSIAIPVWNHEELNVPDGYTYVYKPDYKRKGFYIK